MLAVKLITECSEEEQAALPPEMRRPKSVIIRESRPGEGSVPRNFIWRAIYALKGKTAARDAETAYLKAYALIEMGCGVAASLGGWSKDGRYDPLPDFRDIQKRAARLKARPGGESYLAHRFRDAVANWIELLKVYSAAEGKGA